MHRPLGSPGIPGGPWDPLRSPVSWDPQRSPGDPPGIHMGPFGWRNKLSNTYGIYSKSRKSKNSNKNQKLYTIVHLSARIGAIFKKIILTLQAASARTYFSGAVMGSNTDFMENGLNPSDSSKSKIDMNPSQLQPNLTKIRPPGYFFIPRRLVMAPGPPGTLKTTKNRNL